jgi:hypothetical protein
MVSPVWPAKILTGSAGHSSGPSGVCQFKERVAEFIYNGDSVAENKNRLDLPGFSEGFQSKDITVDIARLFGGRGSSKRSPQPHNVQELFAGHNLSRKRRFSIAAIEIANEEYRKTRRKKFKELKKPIRTPIAAYCIRRYLEFMGLPCYSIEYAECPELIQSKPKIVYEITDGLLTYASFTSSREALLLVNSAARYGIALYFNRIIV